MFTMQWPKTFLARHWGKLLVFQAAVFLGLGFMLSSMMSEGDGTPPAPDTGGAVAEAPASTTVWTCSMHPQIRRPAPGDCPLCGMDLIPVESSVAGPSPTLTVSPEARALMNVETVPVQRKAVATEVEMVGKVAYDETRLGHITAWVDGRLDRMFVDYTGIEVKKGDHMVYLYSEELYSAQAELIGAVRHARGPSGTAGRRLSIGGVDMAKAARHKLRMLGLTASQIRQIEEKERPSTHMTIYAPFGGVVIKKLRQQGERVSRGDRLYTVADLSQVWVNLDAYESDLPWVRYGQEVTFTAEAFPGQRFTGRIGFIHPVLDDMTRTVKVRVVVPNPDGKLKPGMFVRGKVHARLGAGGRLIDPDLSGKWISPMHPWIVKDSPGKCDVCGMPLVKAETLGYVSADGDYEPLVIPASAPLITGKRAVVYVELPEADRPTFEGREIVLGPRAGDYYIVLDGLAEGELVVYRGNFKIDSEIQIQAKPSMMSPKADPAERAAGGDEHRRDGAHQHE